MEITRRTFIDAFTNYQGVMPVDELVQRLHIIHESVLLPSSSPESKARHDLDCLRGVAIRLAQALGDADVSALVNQIIDVTLQRYTSEAAP